MNEGAALRLSVECDMIDVTALWDAAAETAAADFAMLPDDVADTIGPREDPDVEACASMLFDRIARRSGAFNAITITLLPALTSSVYRLIDVANAA